MEKHKMKGGCYSMFKQLEDQLNALSQRKAKSLRLSNLPIDSDEFVISRSGTLRVGIPSVIGTYLFPRLISAFCTRYPQYELSIVEEGTASIIQLLQEGKLDVGFVVLFGETENLDALPVASGQMLVCMPPEHKLAALPAIPMAELRNEQLIMLKKGTYIRRMIIEQCQKNGFAPNIVFSTSQLQTMVQLVKNEVGLTFLLDYIAQDQQGIVCKPLEDPITVNTGLVWPKGQNLSEAGKAFVEVVKESFASLEKPFSR